jgi:hypothetical protein
MAQPPGHAGGDKTIRSIEMLKAVLDHRTYRKVDTEHGLARTTVERQVVDAEAANRLLEGRAPGVESAGDDLPAGGDSGESGLDISPSIGNGQGRRDAETRVAVPAADTVRRRRATAEAKAAGGPNADAGAEFDLPPAGQGGEPTFAQLLGRVAAMGLATNRFEAYADRRWGSGWKLNRHGRRRAWDELERFRNDAAGYIDKIEIELRAAS